MRSLQRSATLAGLCLVGLLAPACGSAVAPSGPGELDGDPMADGGAPLEIRVATPERAAFIPTTTGDRVRVAGRVVGWAGQEVTLNGRALELAADGSFEREQLVRPGINVLDLRAGGLFGARAQRSFLYGPFAPPDEPIPSAVMLYLARAGLDDDDATLDDLAALAERAISAADPVGALPGSYSLSVPVAGTITAQLTERFARAPRVDLSPRAGGLDAVARLDALRIRYDISYNCFIKTCHVTGTVTAGSIAVALGVDVGLDGDEVAGAPRDVAVEITGFRNQIDGALGGVVQSIIDFFVPDLVHKIEDKAADEIAASLPDELAVALSQLALPRTIDLAPALAVRLVLDERLDRARFDAEGGELGVAVAVTTTLGDSGRGSLAPGVLRLGSAATGFGDAAPFGASVSIDLINQILFAIWGAGALDSDLRAGAFLVGSYDVGATHITLPLPPVVVPGAPGQLHFAVGDVIVDTTLDGIPTRCAVSIEGDVELALDPAAGLARIALVGNPVIYAELLAGPAELPGAAFSALVEGSAPQQITAELSSIPLPLPSLPVGAVDASLRGVELRLATPVTVAVGQPIGRVTLYGRLSP